MSLNMATREAYGQILAELGEKHLEIVVMDADLSGSTKTSVFKKKFPERFFNVGVAEQNLMGTAAGLALSGKTVFVSTFALFASGRAWEPVRQSIAYPKANVKICATHAGITVGEDGASHQSIEDIALMRVIPDMQVLVPADARQTMRMMEYAVDYNGPVYLRLGRAKTEQVFDENYEFKVGKGDVLKTGTDVCLFTTGFVTKATLEAAIELDAKGISTSVVCLGSIKPLDEELVVEMAKNHKTLFSVEEHSVIGGLGSAIAETVADKYPAKLHRLGLQDVYGQSATYQNLIKHYKLDKDGIVKSVLEKLG